MHVAIKTNREFSVSVTAKNNPFLHTSLRIISVKLRLCTRLNRIVSTISTTVFRRLISSLYRHTLRTWKYRYAVLTCLTDWWLMTLMNYCSTVDESVLSALRGMRIVTREERVMDFVKVSCTSISIYFCAQLQLSIGAPYMHFMQYTGMQGIC